MDMALCSALSYNTRDAESGLQLPKALVVYDIACQYKKNFQFRLASSMTLQRIYAVPYSHIEWAVGKFHLGVHISECYPDHSLNHKEGTGQLSGENMEPAWNLLNAASKTARVMGLGHREEFMVVRIDGINYNDTTGFGNLTHSSSRSQGFPS